MIQACLPSGWIAGGVFQAFTVVQTSMLTLSPKEREGVRG